MATRTQHKCKPPLGACRSPFFSCSQGHAVVPCVINECCNNLCYRATAQRAVQHKLPRRNPPQRGERQWFHKASSVRTSVECQPVSTCAHVLVESLHQQRAGQHHLVGGSWRLATRCHLALVYSLQIRSAAPKQHKQLQVNCCDMVANFSTWKARIFKCTCLHPRQAPSPTRMHHSNAG
jgi:hypothetical protein